MLRCPNPMCPEVIQAQIVHFVSRDAMNIKGLGERHVAMLVNCGLIKDVADLYKLEVEHILYAIQRAKDNQ